MSDCSKAFVGADTALEGNEDPAVGHSDGTERPPMEIPVELLGEPSMPPAPADEITEDNGSYRGQYGSL